MARYYSAAQYEQDFLPHRLCNWQVNPALEHKSGGSGGLTNYSISPQPRRGSTKFIVDSNGHLKPGVKRVTNSFRLKLDPADSAPTRWPKPSVHITAAPTATMGYKGYKSSCSAGKSTIDGIVTTRLPRPHLPARGAAATAPATLQ